MIELYSGTPGSGKSLRAAYKIWTELRLKRPVIANFDIDLKVISKNGDLKIGKFTYKNNQELTPEFLDSYARENHKPYKEHQTLLVLDEVGIMLSFRDMPKMTEQEKKAKVVTMRERWTTFLMQHRKKGFDIIIIAQTDRMLDRWIRAFIEVEWQHRNIRHYKLMGFIMSLLTGGCFIAIETWYGAKLKCSQEMFFVNKKKASIYNTYAIFEKQ